MQTPSHTWFIGLSRRKKAFMLISADLFFAMLALWAAFSLRWGEWYSPKGDEWYLFAAAPIIAVPIFVKLGLYRAIIRYMEVRALWTIIQATTLYALVFAFVLYESGIKGVPRTVLPLNWLNMMVLVGGSRFFARWWLGEVYLNLGGARALKRRSKKNVVIYGAGSAGVQLASALSHGHEFRPVAFLDDDASLHRQKVNGLRIYPLSSLRYLIERHQVSDVLLAMPSATRARKSEIIHLLEPFAIHVLSMPGLSDIAQGKVTVDALQEIDVADLLGRDAVPPDQSLLHANIAAKVVMVTGAGGSIGAELCRQIVRLQPTSLILFELSEFALYALEKDLLHLLSKLNNARPITLVPLLGSVVDAQRIEKVCKAFKVQTIYHAAAYKHVPMVEKNPGEAVWNNIFGTLYTAQAAINSGVETFVLISTDKAVRPTNTMGATKRFAELILQALSLQQDAGADTRFTMVRFGNVLGSSGSVVPLFKEQIARGGPVTVTDERVIRYFMTIPEAAQLVIQAGAMGQGGDVFVLDMGEPVRIVDLAKRMIHLSGLEIRDAANPDGDIEISFTGLRPGEKLYEELLIGDNVCKTDHARVMRAQEHVIPWAELEPMLAVLAKATEDDDFARVRAVLIDAVAGFSPQCGIEDLLWKSSGSALS
ncbi:MAG: nucleoside-diphosphate sugar epimerase/dehydratase [Methylobacter sp.]|nr:nucleoside-diphosphate sugar epimerase/dehydratase [Methylobacter sp.]MDP2427116.1 nucleoside-diphosphate sugar epimerase/dehydratase [Methylobacter sp.]MDP3053671.1 nucleoside-diphosphate sugar epimerase/dehydratase [Methylobacter sp.]MDP3361076.1 nucleoside-diphosphate sugar epimerase/dehydratase [Methylobacter sp.]MDZ4217986.1 nucleoside-diphosphate sugar epimerase/dehydratase [Methylobacter sp.]